MRSWIVIIFLSLLIGFKVSSQNTTDTTIRIEHKSPGAISILFKGKPGKAFIYSLILPGAGQVYNGKLWKVPVIYTGLGLLLYSVQFNSGEFKRYDSAYRLRVDAERMGEPSSDEFKNILSLQGINSFRQFYDRNLQLSYIGIGLVYLLNAIEAFVDRHLQEFDVSENLSFKFTPGVQSYAGTIGVVYTF
jgi:hypothetical protein